MSGLGCMAERGMARARIVSEKRAEQVMTDTYKFQGGEQGKAFGPLPPGDYLFTVAECGEPYYKNDKWILAVRLAIQPGGEAVFANPWSGETKDGEARDGIGDFLLAVNRAPKLGAEPDWKKVVGARGKCRLKTEVAQAGALEGKEVNKVAFFHQPKELEVRADLPEKLQKMKQAAEEEPQDIPF